MSVTQLANQEEIGEAGKPVTFVFNPDGGSITLQVEMDGTWVDATEAYSASTSVDVYLRNGVKWRPNITGGTAPTVHYY